MSEIDYWEALDEGKVLEYSVPMQSGLYIRKLSDVGTHAYEWQHKNSVIHVLGAHEGKMYAAGVIESDKGTVRDVITLEEARDMGLFKNE